MLQLFQDIKRRDLKLLDVPVPSPRAGTILVRTVTSLISAGTEKMLVDLGQKSIVGKAAARPDLVREVVRKAQKEGVLNTLRNVASKMEKPMPLGYSAAGIVESGEIRSNQAGSGAGPAHLYDAALSEPRVGWGRARGMYRPGTRVAIAGAGYANHSEMNVVPVNLVAKIPDNVSFEEASYATVASIAMQGVRLARPEIGDIVVVSGLGLIGLLTIQILKANGCRVIGLDFDPAKLDIAYRLGIDEVVDLSSRNAVQCVDKFTHGRWADRTIVTAATKSNQPIELAGEVTRRKGRVVVVGLVGMNIPRDTYYKKELTLEVSMSYGPGRYDPGYEENGIDYPYDYVRWTEQRNMEAVLDLMAQGKLKVRDLTTHKFTFKDALNAYHMITESKEPYIGIVLEYDTTKEHNTLVRLAKHPHGSGERTAPKARMSVGFVGAGNYADLHLLPHLAKNKNVALAGLVNSTGLNAKQKAEKYGFRFCSTEFESVLKDASIDTVFISTRHSTHARYVLKALEAGKNVFVEKPLCVNDLELDDIIRAYEGANKKPGGPKLAVGFNRRFAPMVRALKENFSKGPKQINYRVNAGYIPVSTWMYEPAEGGGMMVGEMCHFVDLMIYLTDESPVSVYADSLRIDNANFRDADNIALTIRFSGGSTGVLAYTTVGDKAFSKERIEVYGEGRVGVVDDFRSLILAGKGKSVKRHSMNQDKGQRLQIQETVEAVMRGSETIEFGQIVNGMRVIFSAMRSLQGNAPVQITAYE